MPKGTPFCLKCPKCKRGQFGHDGQPRCMKTGNIERRITRSAHCGHGSGGSGFRGHRGEVACENCGHKWWSTHPRSGRTECWPTDTEPCAHFPKRST